MATFYGSDTACLSDVPLIDLQVTDPRILIGQRIARRLQTPRGGLASINDDPNFGWDVRQYVNKKLSPGELLNAQHAIQAECLKDEQVIAATVTLDYQNTAIVISIQGQSSAGPFALTLNVQQLTVEAVFSF